MKLHLIMFVTCNFEKGFIIKMKIFYQLTICTLLISILVQFLVDLTGLQKSR